MNSRASWRSRKRYNAQSARKKAAAADAAKPVGLVIRRSDGKIQPRSAIVPDAVTVRRSDVKTVLAGWQIAVEGLSAGSRVLPIPVTGFELIAEPDSLRNGIAQRRVADIDVARVRREADETMNCVLLPIGADSLYVNRWRAAVLARAGWIEHLHNRVIDEPKPSVRRFGRSRLKRAGIRHCAIQGVKYPALNHAAGLPPPAFEFGIGDSDQAAFCIEPQRSVIVPNRAINRVAFQPVLGREGLKPAILPANQTGSAWAPTRTHRFRPTS